MPRVAERYKNRRERAKKEKDIRLFISFLRIIKDRAAFNASAATREAFEGIEDANSYTLSRVLKNLPFFISGLASAFLSKSRRKPSIASFAFPSPDIIEGASSSATSILSS